MTKADDIVVLAADHNGVAHKAHIKQVLAARGLHCIDLGPYAETVSVDYVDYARQLAMVIRNGDAKRGILICGTGIGMSIAANKVEGIRAALVHNPESAEKCREHNDANVLCLGAWVNSAEANEALAVAWITGQFGEHRHVRRIEKIDPAPQERIVFTNGIFDILHAGHIELLRFSKSLGGRLVVGINSDRATRLLKGPERPVNREQDRKAVLETIRYVDQVVIFDDVSSTTLVEQLRPQVVVKGGEWTADEVRRRDHIPENIIVKVCPVVVGYSSTNVIKHIRGAHA